MKTNSFLKFSRYGVLFLLLTGTSFAEEIPYYRLSLNQCYQLALQNNAEIRAADLDIDTIVAKKIEATKRYVPVTSYKYRVGPVPRDLNDPGAAFVDGDVSVFNSFHVDVAAPISTFGRISSAQALADLGINLKTLEKQKKSDEVVLNVYKLYQGILLARELKSVLREGINAVTDKVAGMEKDSTKDQIGILKLKVILYEAERRFQEADSKEAIAVATMKVLMGLDDAVDFNIKDTNLKKEPYQDKPFEVILEKSKKNRSEFKLLEKGVVAKGMQAELEKKAYLPNLGWGGFADIGVAPGIRGDESDNTFTNPFNYKRAGVGFELSGTLDFRQAKSKIALAEAEYLKTVAQKRAAFGGLELDLKKSYLELHQYQFLLSRAEQDKKAAREIVFLTKSNLDLGVGEAKDYLDALQSYLVFEGRVLEAIFNYNAAVATVKAKIGELLTGLK